MIGFSTSNGRSPVAQDFIWLSECYDGTHLAEFDFSTKAENDFYMIQRDKLLRFGLIGCGNKLFFERDGVFYLNGRALDIIYRTKDKEYFLTGHFGKYTADIITYKDAESAFHPQEGLMPSRITQYNFGYKAEVEVDGVKFNIKPIVKIPCNQPVLLNLRLVANRKLDGEIVIRVNNREAQVIKAPLKRDVSGEINWIVGL
jgi:hypothetical protein